MSSTVLLSSPGGALPLSLSPNRDSLPETRPSPFPQTGDSPGTATLKSPYPSVESPLLVGSRASKSPGAGGSSPAETRQSRPCEPAPGEEGSPHENAGAQKDCQTETSTKAGKARRRLQLACARCRRRKTKCTGELPTCSHCLKARIPCVYKTTRRKPAPRTNYMVMLDKALLKMEARILRVTPKHPKTLASEPRGRSVDKPSPRPPTCQPSPSDDCDQFWAPDCDFEWGTRDGSMPPTLEDQGARRCELMAEGHESLPPVEIQEHLSKIFFTHLYGQPYFLLHKPSYMAKLRAGCLPPVLILTVCAVAARFSAHPRIQTVPKFLSGERWASRARRICTTRLDRPNLTLVTCLVLLSLHDFGTCHGARSWALGGQAIRMAFALRLHREDDHGGARSRGQEYSFVNREIRRRIMWACFIIDRFNSSSTARPIFIRDDMISLREPIREDSFQLGMPRSLEEQEAEDFGDDLWEQGRSAKDSASVAAHMVRAVSIWGKIICYLNQGGKEKDPHPLWDSRSVHARLLEDAETIVEALPASLAYNDVSVSIHDADNTTGQFFFLHITIQQNILALNHAVMAAPRGIPRVHVTRATSKAFVAAARISHLLTAIGSRAVNAPFVGYSAFSSAMIQLEGIFCGNPWIENSTRTRLMSNIKYLHQMKHHWGVFHWMIENIRDRYRCLSRKAKQRQMGLSTGEGSPRTIGDYSEWFDRYPQGVSHIDFVEPANKDDGAGEDDAVLEQKPEWITVGEYLERMAPTPEPVSREAPEDEQEDEQHRDELERLLMSLGEPSMSTDPQGGMAVHFSDMANPALQGGTVQGMQDTNQFPGAYYGFLDAFSSGHANLFGLHPKPSFGDETFASAEGAEGRQVLQLDDGGAGGQDEAGVDQVEIDDGGGSWEISLDDTMELDEPAPDLADFEGCETLSVLQPYVTGN